MNPFLKPFVIAGAMLAFFTIPGLLKGFNDQTSVVFAVGLVLAPIVLVLGLLIVLIGAAFKRS